LKHSKYKEEVYTKMAKRNIVLRKTVGRETVGPLQKEKKMKNYKTGSGTQINPKRAKRKKPGVAFLLSKAVQETRWGVI